MRPPRGAAVHHARLWYALADLYERAGDAPKARELFGRVVAVEPGLADAAERLAGSADVDCHTPLGRVAVRRFPLASRRTDEGE